MPALVPPPLVDPDLPKYTFHLSCLDSTWTCSALVTWPWPQNTDSKSEWMLLESYLKLNIFCILVWAGLWSDRSSLRLASGPRLPWGQSKLQQYQCRKVLAFCSSFHGRVLPDSFPGYEDFWKRNLGALMAMELGSWVATSISGLFRGWSIRTLQSTAT